MKFSRFTSNFFTIYGGTIKPYVLNTPYGCNRSRQNAQFFTKTGNSYNSSKQFDIRSIAAAQDGSTVFARLCQCAPHLVHTNRHPHRTIPVCPLLSAESLCVYRPPDMLLWSPYAIGRPYIFSSCFYPSCFYLSLWSPCVIYGRPM